MFIDYVFSSVQQCVLAIAASYLGVAEDPLPDVSNPQITYFQRVGGIYSSPDDSLLWSGLFVNAVATECLAERVHDSWTGQGATYGNKPIDWLSDEYLPLSQHVAWQDLIPGDVVVWQVSTSANGFRAGVFLAWTGSYALVVAGDQADAVRPTTVSSNGFVGGRRLFYFFEQ